MKYLKLNKINILGVILAIVFLPLSISANEPPNWEPTPNLQYNMNIVAKLQLSDGSFSVNENDLVAGFVDNECRGVISPSSSLDGLLFLTISSNQLQGELITFKAYIADENIIVDIDETIVFQNQQLIGTPSEPFIFTYSESPESYNLNLIINPENSGIASGAGTYQEGEVITIIAIPNDGFEFVNWTDVSSNEISNAASFEYIMPGEDVSLTANFTLLSYTLTYQAGENGSISGEAVQVVGHGSSGTPVEAVPNEGFHFLQWSDGVTDNPRIDENVVENITVTAVFEINMYTLTIDIVGNGNILVNSEHYSVPLDFPHADEITLEAIALEGWQFEGWSGDLNSDIPNETIIITNDLNVIATFSEIPVFTLTISIQGEGNTTPPPGAHEYPEGTVVNLSANPVLGYEFEKWVVGGSEFTTQNIQVTINDDILATAWFQETEETQFTLTLDVFGNGTTIPPPGSYIYNENSQVEINAIADSNWEFEKWVINGIDITDNPADVVMDQNITAVAHFAEIPVEQYTLTINSTGNGSVNVDGEPYDEVLIINAGTNVLLEAIADDGWIFEGWSGDLVSDNIQENITIDGDKSITANFSEAPLYYTLSISVEGEGTTDPAAGEHEYPEGSTVELTATSAEGWEFEKWVVNGSDITDNPAEVSMDQDITAVAHFAEIPVEQYTLTINSTGNGSVNVDGEPYDEVLIFNAGTNVLLEAIADDGWIFEGWSGDLVSDNIQENITIDGDKTITANFSEAPVYHTLSISVEGEGTSDPAAGEHDYPEGSTVELTATSAEGWEFEKWVVNGIEETHNPLEVMMTENIYAVAYFTEIMVPQYSLTIHIVGDGTVSVNGNEYTQPLIFDEGTEINLEAVAEEGWGFHAWSGDLTSEEPNINFILNEETDLTATFILVNTIPKSFFSNMWVYPNPFNDKIIIENTFNIRKIIITDISGRQIGLFETGNTGTETIFTANLNSGIYFLAVYGENGDFIVKKVIKE